MNKTANPDGAIEMQSWKAGYFTRDRIWKLNMGYDLALSKTDCADSIVPVLSSQLQNHYHGTSACA